MTQDDRATINRMAGALGLIHIPPDTDESEILGMCYRQLRRRNNSIQRARLLLRLAEKELAAAIGEDT